MAYDVKNNMLPMVNAQPRTPGPNDMLGALSRGDSFVSVLSDEHLSSTVSDGGSGTSVEPTNIMPGQEDGLGIANLDDGSKSDSEELRCKKCGGENFSVVKSQPGRSSNGMGLKCRRCGEQVS